MATRLNETMTQLQSTPTHHHMRQKRFVSSNLSHHRKIFVQQDTVRQTLQKLYHCPHDIIKHGGKTFTIDVNEKQELISLNHLKPAHTEDSYMINVTAMDV